MRSTRQWAALAFGVVFLIVGILGLLMPDGMTMDADMETAPRLFGLFPVNLLHNIVHLLFGVWGLVAARDIASTRMYGKAGAAIYALLVVLAFVSPTGFGLVPIGSHDIWLHAVLAAGLAAIGFVGADRDPYTSR
jgi:hypothetical protein